MYEINGVILVCVKFRPIFILSYYYNYYNYSEYESFKKLHLHFFILFTV